MVNAVMEKETNVQGLSTEQIIDKVNFDVKKESIFTRGGIEIDDKFAIVRADNGYPLGVVSDRYKIIKHADAIREPLKILNKGGFDVRRFDVWAYGGAVSIDLTSTETIKINGDNFKYKMTVINSYNKSTAFKIDLGLFRLKCLNGMGVWVDNLSASRSIYHVGDDGNMDLEFAEITRSAIDVYAGIDKFKGALNRLSDIKIGDDEYATRVLMSGFKYSEKRIGEITDAWKQDINFYPNAYGLFNAITWDLTRRTEREGRAGNAVIRSNVESRRAIEILTDEKTYGVANDPKALAELRFKGFEG